MLSNRTKKRKASRKTKENDCVLVRAFIGRSRCPLLGTIFLSCALLCAPMRSCAFPYVPVRPHVFAIHQNWPLSEIICKLRAILCVIYGLGLAFVVDFSIPCVFNVIASNWPKPSIRYSYKSALEFTIIYIVSLQIGIWMQIISIISL